MIRAWSSIAVPTWGVSLIMFEFEFHTRGAKYLPNGAYLLIVLVVALHPRAPGPVSATEQAGSA